MSSFFFRVALAAVAIVMTGPVTGETPRAVPVVVSVDETARFLAGLPPLSDPLLCDLTGEEAWQRHAEVLDAAWADLEKGRLSKVRQWSATHIAEASAAQGTMFYMFSGPDFLYADAFYPGATTYVFCGTEPVGPIPDLTRLSRSRIPGELQALRTSLDSVLSFSFFITNRMKKDLRNHDLSGTLPVLSIFLARAGKTICDVGYVGLDKVGGLHPLEAPERSDHITAPGVKITFGGTPCATPRTLYYFRTDISDSGLGDAGFLEFCRGLAPGNSLVKSASYLMHKSYFSQIRTFLLGNSGTLVQDDSGIPVSFFTPERWELRVFGTYPGPIALFREHTQAELFRLYRDTDPVPLNFGIGYRHRIGESTLMVARRRPDNWTREVPKAIPVTMPASPPLAEADTTPATETTPATQ